jgi:hypothetical protein
LQHLALTGSCSWLGMALAARRRGADAINSTLSVLTQLTHLDMTEAFELLPDEEWDSDSEDEDAAARPPVSHVPFPHSAISLAHLGLARIQISDAGEIALAAALQGHANLASCSLPDCFCVELLHERNAITSIRSQPPLRLLNALAALPSLRCLTVGVQRGSSSDVLALGQHLAHLTQLESLEFQVASDNDIVKHGAGRSLHPCVSHIAALTALQRLSFSVCELSDWQDEPDAFTMAIQAIADIGQCSHV